MTDQTGLSGCDRLLVLDLGETPVDSLAALDGLDVLVNLVVCRIPLHSLEGITAHSMLEEIYL
ncbi:hypothetical protein KQH62_03460 [bacterium]|nr:hypothetical protein [bacterium]